MINVTERLSNRLLKPWVAKGLLIFEKKAQYVEVAVPFLALDSREVAQAVASDFQAAVGAKWDERAFAPGITAEELGYYNQKLNHERQVAESGFTLAAAILSHRGCAFPIAVSRDCLSKYLHRSFLRGGRGVIDAGPVEFLFMADELTPIIYATDLLAEVTRFTGRECLSIRVGDDELSLRVNEALENLNNGGLPTPRSVTNMEDWLTRDKLDGDDDKYDE